MDTFSNTNPVLSLGDGLDISDFIVDDILENCENELLKSGPSIFNDDFSFDQLIDDEIKAEDGMFGDEFRFDDDIKPETNEQENQKPNVKNPTVDTNPTTTKIPPVVPAPAIQIPQQVYAYVTPDQIQQFIIQTKLPREPTTIFVPQMVQPTKIITPGVLNVSNIPNVDAKIPISRMPTQYTFTPGVKEKPKEKRSDHNAIERKYRTSINDKIVELREMLVGSNASLNKSAVLRRAIDTLTYLRSENARLTKENHTLKLRLGVDAKDSVSMTPPHSDMSLSPPHDESMPASPGSDDYNYATPATYAMMDSSRLMLCALMLIVVTFNPLSAVVTRFHTDDSSMKSSRLLLGIVPETSWSLSSAMCVINFLLFVACAFKIFIFADPIVTGLVNDANYSKRKKLIDTTVLNGDTAATEAELVKCLNFFGRPLPLTSVELILAVLWQLFRQFLHCLPGGRWLSRNSTVIFDADKRQDALATGKELAIVYHNLNKLQLVKSEKSRQFGLYLSLNAVNIAEASADLLTPIDMCEMYVTMAFQLKQSCPVLKLHMYYLHLARRQALKSCDDIPIHLAWLFTPYGTKYFMYNHFTFHTSASIFVSATGCPDPLKMPVRIFREHLLQRALTCLVAPRTPRGKTRWSIGDALVYTQLLRDNLGAGSTVKTVDDQVAYWWSNVLTVAAFWLQGDVDKALALYGNVKKVPKRIVNDPLVKGLLIAFSARGSFLMNPQANHATILARTHLANNFLSESVAKNADKPASKTTLFVQLLACDWLLETRTSIWEARDVNVDAMIFDGFKRDLLLLENLTQFTSVALPRVFLYEAVLRLVAKASPNRTQQLLVRNLQKEVATVQSVICGSAGVTSVCGEREQAHALYLACKHLPDQFMASPEERAGMLTEAAQILERLGDRKRLTDCLTLMKAVS